jgi:hypothetical protein
MNWLAQAGPSRIVSKNHWLARDWLDWVGALRAEFLNSCSLLLGFVVASRQFCCERSW